MRNIRQFTPPARGVIVAGALALVMAVMKLAAPILTPLLLAVFIAVVATPALRWMRRKGVPKWGALGLIAFVLLDLGSLLALIATGALEGFRDSFPTYQERFMLLSQQAGVWLERLGLEHSQEAIPDLLDPNKVMGLVRLARGASGHAGVHGGQHRCRELRRAASHGPRARHFDARGVPFTAVLGLAVRPGGHVSRGAAHRGTDRGARRQPAYADACDHAGARDQGRHGGGTPQQTAPAGVNDHGRHRSNERLQTRARRTGVTWTPTTGPAMGWRA